MPCLRTIISVQCTLYMYVIIRIWSFTFKTFYYHWTETLQFWYGHMAKNRSGLEALFVPVIRIHWISHRKWQSQRKMLNGFYCIPCNYRHINKRMENHFNYNDSPQNISKPKISKNAGTLQLHITITKKAMIDDFNRQSDVRLGVLFREKIFLIALRMFR